jgi:hypothetical protein
MQFSGLPHLGFFYSFGSKGVQTIHADYQQKLGKATLLNMVLDRISSNGIIRNSNFTKSNFQLFLNRESGRYKYGLQARYAQNKTNLSGGLTISPTQISDYVFTPVNNENAVSETKIGQLLLTNRLSLTKDSALIEHGLISFHSFQLLNRTYKEQGDIAKLYPVYIDSLSTEDQYQVNDLLNGFGYYVAMKKFELIGSLTHNYSQLQNLGWFSYRNDVSGKLKLKFTRNGIRFQNETSMVLFNQTNSEFSINQYNPIMTKDFPLGYSNSKFEWGNKKLDARGSLELSNSQLTLAQGFLRANSYSYPSPFFNSDPYARIKKINASLGLDYQILTWLSIHSNTEYLRLSNGVLWNGNVWGKWNAENRLGIIQSKLSVVAKLKNFRFEPSLTLTEGLDNLPTTSAGSRISLTKRVFEAKKMKLLMALEIFYSDSYRLMSYDGRVDSWQVAELENRSENRYFVNATFGFEIEEFRFFTKFENIQTLWNKKVFQIAENYYSSPFLVRLGITWDFFN